MNLLLLNPVRYKFMGIRCSKTAGKLSIEYNSLEAACSKFFEFVDKVGRINGGKPILY